VVLGGRARGQLRDLGEQPARGPLAVRDEDHEEPGALLRLAHVPAADPGLHPDPRLHRPWDEGIKKYDEIEPGRQLLNDFFWHNYRKGVYVVGFWKYWMQLKGVISGHKVRWPLVDMTPDEEKWLKNRFEMLQKGTHPRSKGELLPYPQQRAGASAPSQVAL
jgi:hypothetical protein